MSEFSIEYYLYLAGFLVCAGLLIIIIKRNVVFVLMGIELILNAANLNLVAYSRLNGELEGNIFAVFSIVLAAAEVAIALAILLNIYRYYRSSNLDDYSELKN